MTFRVFSVARRISKPHLCRFKSSSSPLNGFNRESILGVRSIVHSQLKREFKDHLAKLNDQSEKVKHKTHKMLHLTEDSVEFESLVESRKTWLPQHARCYFDCRSKLMGEFFKLRRRMHDTMLGIDKECADYQKLREDYISSVTILIMDCSLYVVVFGLFYKAGDLLKPADDST